MVIPIYHFSLFFPLFKLSFRPLLALFQTNAHFLSLIVYITKFINAMCSVSIMFFLTCLSDEYLVFDKQLYNLPWKRQFLLLSVVLICLYFLCRVEDKYFDIYICAPCAYVVDSTLELLELGVWITVSYPDSTENHTWVL